jgi:hypothetical protein
MYFYLSFIFLSKIANSSLLAHFGTVTIDLRNNSILGRIPSSPTFGNEKLYLPLGKAFFVLYYPI